jgi:hypothetical protein
MDGGLGRRRASIQAYGLSPHDEIPSVCKIWIFSSQREAKCFTAVAGESFQCGDFPRGVNQAVLTNR